MENGVSRHAKQNGIYSFASFTGDGNAVFVDDKNSQCAMCSTQCVCVCVRLLFCIWYSDDVREQARV